ncbi:hypothetical protein [Rhizobium leguminosarum]|nr:hypothetical protein [Rhizobium leguminosarum]
MPVNDAPACADDMMETQRRFGDLRDSLPASHFQRVLSPAYTA